MGTPARLNFSLPGLALRLSDPPRPGGELPEAWVSGNMPQSFSIRPGQAALSLGTSLLALVPGLFLIWRVATGNPTSDDRTLYFAGSALITLALLVSPLSWYHYQLFQLFGGSWLAVRFLERRAGLQLAVLGTLLAAMSWTHRLGVGLYVNSFGWTAAVPCLLWLISSLVPLCSILFLLVLAREAVTEEPLPPRCCL